MSEGLNGNLQSPIEKKKTRERSDTGSKTFIDSVFLSSSLLVLMTVIVVIAIFVMGYFVFSLKDREVKLAIDREWLSNSEEIIQTAKIYQKRLTALRDTVPKIEATKATLLFEEEAAKADLQRTINQLNHAIAEQNEVSSSLEEKRKSVAASEGRKSELNDQLPPLEQNILNLLAQQTSLREDIRIRQSDLSSLDGKVNATRAELDALVSKVKTIASVDSNFSNIKRGLNTVLTDLNAVRARAENTTSNLAIQVTNLSDYNSAISIEKSLLVSTNQSLTSAANTMDRTNTQIGTEVVKLQNSNNALNEASNNADELNRRLTVSQQSIDNLITAINSTSGQLDQLSSSARSSRNTLASNSTDILNDINSMSATLRTISTEVQALKTQFQNLEQQTQVPAGN